MTIKRTEPDKDGVPLFGMRDESVPRQLFPSDALAADTEERALCSVPFSLHFLPLHGAGGGHDHSARPTSPTGDQTQRATPPHRHNADAHSQSPALREERQMPVLRRLYKLFWTSHTRLIPASSV